MRFIHSPNFSAKQKSSTLIDKGTRYSTSIIQLHRKILTFTNELNELRHDLQTSQSKCGPHLILELGRIGPGTTPAWPLPSLLLTMKISARASVMSAFLTVLPGSLSDLLTWEQKKHRRIN